MRSPSYRLVLVLEIASKTEDEDEGAPGIPGGIEPIAGFCRRSANDIICCLDVKPENSISPAPEPAGLRPRLTELREALLPLHKALLDSEKVSYEATFGKIASPYQFLKLLTEDPWFAWLSPLTKLIAAIDERLDAKEPLTLAAVETLMARARTMLVATEAGEGFSRHFDEALQRTPDVVFAQAAVAKLLRAPAGPKA